MHKLYRIELNPPLYDGRNMRSFFEVEIIAKSENEAIKRMHCLAPKKDHQIKMGIIQKIQELPIPLPEIDSSFLPTEKRRHHRKKDKK